MSCVGLTPAAKKGGAAPLAPRDFLASMKPRLAGEFAKALNQR